MRRPRLLIMASTYPRWAGDHEPGFVHELARRLTASFDVHVLCPHAPGSMRHESLDGVEVHRFRYAPASWETLVNDGGMLTNLRLAPWKWLLVPLFLIANGVSLWRLIRKEAPDVVHAHWLIPQGCLAALVGVIERRFPPFMVTSHGADLFALRSKVSVALKRFVVRQAAKVTVVSHPMKDELVRIGAGPEKIEVQSMGVDLTERFTLDSRIERSRDELLFVGRLVEKKGLNTLIAAMPAIIAHWPAAFLTVAGDGPKASEYKNQVKALGLKSKVHFIGSVQQDELPSLYRRAAVFVAPFDAAKSGDQEGLGLVLAEAIGCGCPLVVGDVPAVHDICDLAPSAMVVPSGEPATLAEAIVRQLEAPPDLEQINCARESIAVRFHWEQRADAYRELLGAISEISPKSISVG